MNKSKKFEFSSSSNLLYEFGIAIAFLIFPFLKLSKGIFIPNSSKVSFVAGLLTVSGLLVLL